MNTKLFIFVIGLILLVGAFGFVSAEKMWNFNNYSVNVSNNVFSGGFVNATTNICLSNGICLSSLNSSLGNYIPYIGSNQNAVLGDYNFSVGTSDFFVDASGGRVGIGTNNPRYRLVVDGVTGFASGSTNAGYVNPTTAGVDFWLSDSTGTGNGFRIDTRSGGTSYLTNGNFGIGTESPGAKLTINSDTRADGIRITSQLYDTAGIAANGTGLEWRWRGLETTSWSYIRNIFLGEGDTELVFGTSPTGGVASERMRINKNGNVGIGTTAPVKTLDVVGDINVTGNLYTGNVYANNTYNYFNSSNMPGIVSGSGTVGYIPLWNSTTSINNSKLYQSGGNVGVGTTNPTSPLRVKSTGGNTDVFTIERYGSSNSIFRILENSANAGTLLIGDSAGTSQVQISPTTISYFNGGNVGVGTNVPYDLLHIKSSTTAELRTESTTAGYSSGVAMIGTSNANWFVGTNRADIFGAVDNIGFYKNTGTTGTKMVIQNNGNVGIGTTSPSNKLDVVGNVSINGNLSINSLLITSGVDGLSVPNYGAQITSTGAGGSAPFDKAGNLVLAARTTDTSGYGGIYLKTGSSSTTRLMVDESGNVGIGTISPTAGKLQVDSGNIALSGTNNKYIMFNSASSWQYYLANSGDDFKIYDSDSVDFLKLNYNGGGTNKYASILSTLNVKNNGNVGIGTTSPTQKLSVKTTSSSDTNFVSFLSANGQEVFDFDTYNNDSDLTMRDNAGTGRIVFGATAGKSNFIGRAGDSFKLGINTATPQNTLNVVGDLNVTNATGTLGLYQNSNGQVGIGTSSPSQKLDVVGNLNVTRSLYLGGTDPSISVGSGSGVKSLYSSDYDYIGIKSWGDNMWLRSNSGTFTFQTFNDGDDWTKTFQFYLPDPSGGSGNPNELIAQLGQRTSNSASGLYKGIKIVKYESNSIQDGYLQAGIANITDSAYVKNSVGINIASPSSTLHVNGSMATAIKTVSGSNYDPTDLDYTILADATSGNVDIRLPAPAVMEGRIYVIKKIDSSNNRVSVVSSGGGQIDGQGNKDLTAQYQSYIIQSDGNNWYIIGHYA